MKKLLFILAYIPFVGMAQVGIGTSSPQAKLHIQGDLRVDSLKNIDYSGYNLVLDTNTNKVALQAIRPESQTLVRVFARTHGNTVNHLTATTIAWQTTEVNTVPSAWNPATGIFTVPRDGIYQVSAQLRYSSNTGNNAEHNFTIYKNGTTVLGTSGNFDSSGNGSTFKPTGAGLILHRFSAGDTIEIKALHGSGGTLTLDNSAWNYISIVEL